MNKSVEEFVAACKTLWTDFNNCKAHFPYVPAELTGEKEVNTAPFYLAQGFNLRFIFSEGISEEDIKRINAIGHWLNQNFIIRLCAILEVFHVISSSSKIDSAIQGATHVNIVRRLRNYIVHESGRYDPHDSEHRKTMEVINKMLHVSTDGLTDWPLSIDTVLKPLYEGCIKYAKKRKV